MPAKLVPYVVMMPEGWEPKWCWESYRHVNHTCSKCLEVYTGTDNPCPLANAKKAVDVQPGTIISLTTKDAGPGKLDLVHKVNGKPVTIYAVEVEK